MLSGQEDKPHELLPLQDWEKIFHGNVKYYSGQSEGWNKKRNSEAFKTEEKWNPWPQLYHLSCDFDFPRYANRRVKCIDGDIPFDANDIKQSYKNGTIHTRPQ